MTYWRQRIGAEKMELLLKETLRTGQRLGVIKRSELKSAVIDTTIQDKAIAYPTDSSLYFKALRTLVRLSKRSGINCVRAIKEKQRRVYSSRFV